MDNNKKVNCNYNPDLREKLEENNAGVTFTYKGHCYLIVSGLILEDLKTGEHLLLGIDF